MRGAFFAIIVSVVSLQGVISVPLKALIGDGSPDNKAKINEAVNVANGQIKNMQAVLNGPNPKSHPAFVKAFGTNGNVDEVKKNVNQMAEDRPKLRIPGADPVSGVTQGATNTATKDVSFGSVFFQSNAKERAGTVIHEAAHALNGAVDHFDQNGNPHPQGSTFDKSKAQVGYKDSHLDQLKAQASHNMHHNADSYRVFGESCPEAREFFRRALEETNHVARAHLIRRGAAACAYHPKGAAKTLATKGAAKASAAKAAAKKVSGSKVAKPVAKTAGSRRPVRASPAGKKAGSVSPIHASTAMKKAGSARPIGAKSAVNKAGSRNPVRASSAPSRKSVAQPKPAVNSGSKAAPRKVAAHK